VAGVYDPGSGLIEAGYKYVSESLLQPTLKPTIIF